MNSPSKPADEFDAARMVVEVLKDLKTDEQAHAIRWAQEKLGIAPAQATAPAGSGVTPHPGGNDISSFIQRKSPANDVQFAATVAYYYAFEAPDANKKNEISADDLREATRLANTARLDRPITTLHNAVQRGYLDKGAERGKFKINTVGENLVAMSLPTANATAAPRRARPSKKK